MTRLLISLNVRLSLVLHNRLPWRFKRDFFRLYYSLVADQIYRQRSRYVLDVGCGRRTYFTRLAPSLPTVFVGLDSDIGEISHNRDLTHLVVSDAMEALPFANGSIDLVTTRSVLEHLTDTDQFFRESFRVLSPGGYFIHIMPGRYSPFAVLNRLSPNRFTKRLLNLLYPEIEGEWGFPAYYKNCSYKTIQLALERSGFEVEQIHCRFYQATYYRAFLPVYALFLAYDLILWMLQVKRLSSQIIVVARKKGSQSAPQRLSSK